MLRIAYGRLGYSREEFFDLSWGEFNCAVEGYFEDLRQRLGIPDKGRMDAPSDAERRRIKERSAKWMKFFKRPTLKAHGEPSKS